MRLVRTENLTPGSRLARDVWTGGTATIPLLRAGAVLCAEYVEGLRRAGVGAVYVEDEASDGIEPREIVREGVRLHAARSLEHALHILPRGQAGGGGAALEAVAALREAVDEIVDEIVDLPPEATLALADLTTSEGYTVQHSIDVTVLGLLLARALLSQDGGRAESERAGRLEGRLRKLGLGLLAHDLGKALLPRSLLLKPGPLDGEEWRLVKGHPLAGAEMLETAEVGPLALTVVRWHHERLDGSGYPDGLDGESLPLFPRIAAVADVYDAITSARPYRRAQPSWVGVREIVAGAGRLYDPAVVDAFRRLVAPYPLGSLVTLSDGRRGLVAAIPPHRPERPLVRILLGPDGRALAPVEVSLLDEPELEIVAGG
jgi:HD-GYP domain-containing protein (c-di-GMP phosphodiesterase class II)